MRRPKHVASLNADYAFDVRDRPGRVNVGVDFHGERTDTDYPATVRLGSFTLLKIVAGWRIRPGVEIYARGENLLDREYEEVLGYGAPGRAIHGGVRATF